MQMPPFDFDVTSSRACPEQRQEQLGLALAVEAGDPHDLACAHLEAHLVQGWRGGQGLDLADHPFADRRFTRRVDPLHGAPEHHFDETGLVQVFGGARADIEPVAEHGDPVAKRFHLSEPVRNEQHEATIASKLADRREEPFDLLGQQGARRLVKEQYSWSAHKRLHDLEHLALGKT